MIVASHLSKIYQNDSVKTIALDDVSFKIDRGEFVAIMGPSGSGKSTLMHIIGALDKPTRGDYLLEGKNLNDFDEDELAEIRNQMIGFVFQFYNLLPRATALRNVTIPMIYGGVSPEKRIQKAQNLLEMVGLGQRLGHFPNQLSGGEQQRVAIARALSMDPSLILADEPTGNIGSDQSQEIMTIFKKLNQAGHTILVITHEPEVATFAKRTIYLRDGRVIDKED